MTYYINPGNSYIPYHSGPYIQRGRGLFNVLGNWATRYAVPWFSRATKLAQSTLGDVVKSKAMKNIVNKAKSAAVEGVKQASNQVLDGTPVGEALGQSVKSTGNKIKQVMKSEAKKAIKRTLGDTPKKAPKKRKIDTQKSTLFKTANRPKLKKSTLLK